MHNTWHRPVCEPACTIIDVCTYSEKWQGQGVVLPHKGKREIERAREAAFTAHTCRHDVHTHACSYGSIYVLYMYTSAIEGVVLPHKGKREIERAREAALLQHIHVDMMFTRMHVVMEAFMYSTCTHLQLYYGVIQVIFHGTGVRLLRCTNVLCSSTRVQFSQSTSSNTMAGIEVREVISMAQDTVARNCLQVHTIIQLFRHTFRSPGWPTELRG